MFVGYKPPQKTATAARGYAELSDDEKRRQADELQSLFAGGVIR